MHAEKLLHKLLDSTIHQTRIKSLIPVVEAIIETKQLSLTRLGRGLNTGGKERAGIRRMDRILGNKYYQEENYTIYGEIIRYSVGSKTKPIIIVDWSGLPNSKYSTTEGEHCILRATLAAEGRGITLYDEVHAKKEEGNEQVHRVFLKKLKSLLPQGCCPIIVTDAGFKNPWFKAVESSGWDYVGRVRGNTCCEKDGDIKKIPDLFEYASSIPKELGKYKVSKRTPLATNIYIYTHKLKGRKKYTKTGGEDKSEVAKKQSRGYRQPWVLMSSLNGSSAAEKVVKIYKMRMAIEENFRDVKSIEYGLSMNENKTIKYERFIVWLMLSALASMLAWIVGYVAEKNNLHYDFQANTCRTKRVLSFFYLGCQILRKKIKISIQLDKIPKEAWVCEI
jgi:Transposase DDE domain